MDLNSFDEVLRIVLARHPERDEAVNKIHHSGWSVKQLALLCDDELSAFLLGPGQIQRLREEAVKSEPECEWLFVSAFQRLTGFCTH